MQDVSFTKAIILAKEGIRSHVKDRKMEENCKDAIIRFTKNTENWIKQVTPQELLFLQYLYIVWKDDGKEIFSAEEYEELFYTPDFEEYVLKSSDYSFKKILVEDNEQTRENFFTDIVLE